MLNLIEIEENKNKLKPKTKIEPIVCGNTNYKIKATFDEDWSKATKILAIFQVLDRTIIHEFSGDTVNIPAMPNASCFMLTLTCTPQKGETYTSNSLKFPLEKSELGAKLNLGDPFESYYASFRNAVDEVQNGQITVKKAETAIYATTAGSCAMSEKSNYSKDAETATFATTAGSATTAETATSASTANYATTAESCATAENATHAITADSATIADSATHATTADSATTAATAETATSASTANYATIAESCETAENATHAITADSATIADSAIHATTADSATTAATAETATSASTANYATTAGTSETQVSKTGNEDIAGVKNFLEAVKKCNYELVSCNEISNPNILINGDLKFNQRLMTSYYGPNVYGPDRWKVVDELAGICATNDSSWEISLEDIETAGERIVLSQKIENYKPLLGKTVTCTLNYKNLTEDVQNSVKLCIYDGVNSTETTIFSTKTVAVVTANISETATQVEVRVKTTDAGLNMSLKMYNCKLEFGPYSTHYLPKPYSEELADCQRFYQPVQVLGATNAPATETTILVNANLVNSLRTKPTATILFGSRMPSLTGNGETIACNGVTVKSMNQSSVVLQFNAKANLTLKQLYSLSECNVALDSELY